ncbi:MAG: AEC family transporter [Caldilineaceae bacterium]|nr:AEC family transporter [Caldilineaceae bacterium]MCB0105934.1 AEC family transporter [Caldilineaceae bacterium]MCB0120748.1 AEC family transporter [Caldilineaceae bacterium]MCB0183219.1 AEC family transporter [Caldilineaceae bacterium]
MFIVQTLLPIFAQTVLPVILVAAAGYGLASAFTIDSKSLGRILFFLATPSLVFRSLYRSELDLTVLQQLAIVTVAVILSSGLMGWLVSIGEDRQRRAAFILTSAISNNGNMGIPISFFAFGEMGLALGSIYYVFTSFMSNTLGVVVASAGQTPVIAALAQSIRVPVLYSATLGLVLNLMQVELPQPLFRAIDLLADAAIPGMLILLGIQLHKAPLTRVPWVVLRSTAVRLLIGPLLAWLLCLGLAIGGVERNVLILQAGMPTAVMAAVLSTEYDTEPELVATVILVSTLISMASLSILLWLML